jgi:hypothetical protein
MAAAGFELVPDLDRARKLGRQVFMRRVSPGCVVMVSRNDGAAYGNPHRPYWRAFGLNATMASNLQVRDVTLAGAVEACRVFGQVEVDRLDEYRRRRETGAAE